MGAYCESSTEIVDFSRAELNCSYSHHFTNASIVDAIEKITLTSVTLG
jgi:hypothetical protein